MRESRSAFPSDEISPPTQAAQLSANGELSLLIRSIELSLDFVRRSSALIWQLGIPVDRSPHGADIVIERRH